jgi:hypothetical protein
VKVRTRKLLRTHPAYTDNHGLPLCISNAYRLEITHDDTTTVARVIDDLTGQTLASGIARRRTGDKRNLNLGVALAMSRLYTAMAEDYAAVVEHHTERKTPHPEEELIRQMRRSNRAVAKQKKDDRRRAAREAWYRNQGRQRESEPSREDIEAWRGRTFGDWGAK